MNDFILPMPKKGFAVFVIDFQGMGKNETPLVLRSYEGFSAALNRLKTRTDIDADTIDFYGLSGEQSYWLVTRDRHCIIFALPSWVT